MRQRHDKLLNISCKTRSSGQEIAPVAAEWRSVLLYGRLNLTVWPVSYASATSPEPVHGAGSGAVPAGSGRRGGGGAEVKVECVRGAELTMPAGHGATPDGPCRRRPVTADAAPLPSPGKCPYRVSDPVHMSRKIRMFRTDKFDT